MQQGGEVSGRKGQSGKREREKHLGQGLITLESPSTARQLVRLVSMRVCSQSASNQGAKPLISHMASSSAWFNPLPPVSLRLSFFCYCIFFFNKREKT